MLPNPNSDYGYCSPRPSQGSPSQDRLLDASSCPSCHHTHMCTHVPPPPPRTHTHSNTFIFRSTQDSEKARRQEQKRVTRRTDPVCPQDTRGLRPWRGCPTPVAPGEVWPGESKAMTLKDLRYLGLWPTVWPQGVGVCWVYLPKGSVLFTPPPWPPLAVNHLGSWRALLPDPGLAPPRGPSKTCVRSRSPMAPTSLRFKAKSSLWPPGPAQSNPWLASSPLLPHCSAGPVVLLTVPLTPRHTPPWAPKFSPSAPLANLSFIRTVYPTRNVTLGMVPVPSIYSHSRVYIVPTVQRSRQKLRHEQGPT